MKINVGDSAAFSKTMTETDVYNFAGISGDFNPVHINRLEAEKSRFGRQVCHGMLVASMISNVLGMKLPGPGTVYLEQELKFVKPVYIGDTVTATVVVEDVKENGIIVLQSKVTNQEDEEVICGKSVVLYK